MKRETRQRHKSTHPRPRGKKWPFGFPSGMTRTARRQGKKSKARRRK